MAYKVDKVDLALHESQPLRNRTAVENDKAEEI